jgi:murein DD-endopeptidase MepM/ murein hydrolase activator NlpD
MVGAPHGAPSAQAHDADPPFEIRFPHEPGSVAFEDTWGARRSGGRRHRGTDLMSPKMTAVYAIADGVVTQVSVGNKSGRHLAIEHPEGWVSHYMHLNNDNPGTDDGNADWSLTLAPGVEPGLTVVAGQLVAWSGDSGNAESDPSHTHFELHHDGVKVNPYPYLYEAWLRDMVLVEARMSLVFRALLGGAQIF